MVDKTIDAGDSIIRKRRCSSCGSRWVTEETMRKGSLMPAPVQARPGLATNGHGRPPPANNQPLVAVHGRGGVGGGLPSVSDPISDPDPSQQSDHEEPRARSIKYAVEFERAWNATAKTGSKFKAYQSWQRVGKPSAEVVAVSWAKWSKLDGWRRGYVPHVVTWLSGRCWEQEPHEVVRAEPVRAQAESFAARDARARAEARERDKRDTERLVAETSRKCTTCELHLYGEGEGRACNPRCNRWQQDSRHIEIVRELAEAKSATA